MSGTLDSHWTRGRGLPPQSDQCSVDQPSFHESTARGDETLRDPHPLPRVLQGYESFEANASPSVRLDSCLTEITRVTPVSHF